MKKNEGESEDAVRVKKKKSCYGHGGEGGRKSIDMLSWCLQGDRAAIGAVLFQHSSTVETVSVCVQHCFCTCIV